jgi:hypothetical protein
VILLTICTVTCMHVYTSSCIGFPGKREMESYEINDPLNGMKWGRRPRRSGKNPKEGSGTIPEL